MTSSKSAFRQKLYEARKAVLEAQRKKREAENPPLSPEQQAEQVLQKVMEKLQAPISLYGHEETPFGEERFEPGGAFSLSATKLKKLPAYKQFIATLRAMCPRFTVETRRTVMKVKEKTVRVWSLNVYHPGVTRAEYFGDRSLLSPYQQRLAAAMEAARVERLKRLRHDRAYIGTFNRQIAAFIPEVERQLIRSYAFTGEVKACLKFAQPMTVPYGAHRLKRFPAYAALEMALRGIDKDLCVDTKEEYAGLGNTDLVVEVTMPKRFVRGND